MVRIFPLKLLLRSALCAAIHESFIFLRKLFERRSGTGILPVRFNQADLFGNSRAGRPCHYFGCGSAALCSFAAMQFRNSGLSPPCRGWIHGHPGMG
jgi:hypothetical protein